MFKVRQKLKENSLLLAFSSMKITVICLSLLLILTFWGTIAQIDQGLYQAQERFFYSWFFTAMGFLPFPGARFVLWILFINLVCATITRLDYKMSHLGLIIVHFGLLSYFISAFITFYVAKESHLTLMEGDGSNVSSSYHEWELSVWEKNSKNRHHVMAYDTDHFLSGEKFSFDDLGFHMTIKAYYPNAQAYVSPLEDSKDIVNDSGIKTLSPLVFKKINPEENMPGGIFEVFDHQGNESTLLLYGAEKKPTEIKIGSKFYNFMLRHKRFSLPMTLTLKDFDMQVHPGTDVAKSYKSLVQIEHDDLTREVLIYMNHPLRYKDYTFYQASYAIDSLGRQLSTLAVVKNSGRLLPYISCSVVFIGLLIHFLVMAFTPPENRVL